MRYSLHKQAQASLHSGLDIKSAVRLPTGEKFDDWLAVHSMPLLLSITFVVAVDFFNRINLMYGTISDVCTSTSCPTMCGGAK
jgi:hypothetical protein